jgi:hypothetical protein
MKIVKINGRGIFLVTYENYKLVPTGEMEFVMTRHNLHQDSTDAVQK